MAYLLQKGQRFTIGTDGTSGALENTIQSFNGGIGTVRGNMYVEIETTGTAITPQALSNIHGQEPFNIVITSAEANRSKVEVGDTITLYNSGDASVVRHSYLVTAVVHGPDSSFTPALTSGQVGLTGYISDHSVTSDMITDTDTTITTADVFSSTTFVNIRAAAFTNIDRRLVDQDIVSAEIVYTTGSGSPLEIVPNSELPGLISVNFVPDATGGRLVLAFSNAAQANAAVDTIHTHINAQTGGAVTLNMTVHATATTADFNAMDSEHVIHVGSKTKETVQVVTPITLPTGVTITAGSNVGDIFLVHNSES